MQKIPTAQLIILTPLFIWLSHYVGLFPHEYAHSFTAWVLGDMKNPLALYYGGTSIANILLFVNIDENVEYSRIFAEGHNFHVALIAYAGSGIGSALMFVLCAALLKNKRVKQKSYLYYFVFWVQLMNVGNFFDYVPIRTFSTHGDVANMVHGLGISPWWVFAIFGYIIAFLMWQFFTKTMPAMFATLNIKAVAVKAGLTITCVLFMFVWFGGVLTLLSPGNPMPYGETAWFLNIASVIAIPGIVYLLWPTRRWMAEGAG